MFEESYFSSMRRLYRRVFLAGPEGSPVESFFFDTAVPDSAGLGTSSVQSGGMIPGSPVL